MASTDEINAVATAVKAKVDTLTYDAGLFGKINVGNYVTPEEIAMISIAAVDAHNAWLAAQK